MDVSGVTPHPFRMLATVPEGMVGMSCDGEWAAWTGFWSSAADGRDAVVLVSITVTAFDPPAAGEPRSACDVLAARLRLRHPEPGAVIEEFRTPGGAPGVCLRSPVTERVRGREITTWQAQALVAYPGAGALGVVSAVTLDPDDIGTATALVTEIAAGMTVTVATAAALSRMAAG